MNCRAPKLLFVTTSEGFGIVSVLPKKRIYDLFIWKHPFGLESPGLGDSC